MPKDTNVVETTNANKVFDIPVKLEPGQINTLAFAQDSISEMRELPQGELEIVFRDGSKVVVENFDELVNSAQSCGRDTLIQLSDNTIIYPEELAAQLDKGPVNFEVPTVAGAVLLDAPKAGQVVEKNIQPGQEYKLNFSLDSTLSAAQAGQNLILTFKDGGVLMLKNYYDAIDSDLPPTMSLADGSVIDANALLTSCKLVEIPAVADGVAQGAVAEGQVVAGVSMVEPAAGEEVTEEEAAAAAARKKAAAGEDSPPDVEPAAGEESLANIEPAAGDAGGAPTSSGRGYGFNSSIDEALLNGADPIGPIGATALQYGANFPIGDLSPGTDDPFVDTQPVVLSGGEVVDETNLGPLSVTGNANANFGQNGPGTVEFNTSFTPGGSLAGGALTSGGIAVAVTLDPATNTYTGVAGGTTVFTLVIDPVTGDYTFTQFQPLDHADGADPDDLITLQFGVDATDSDGDVGSGTITIGVCDDAPVAIDDGHSVGSGPFTVNGNVTANDDEGADGATVTQVVYNGTIYTVPAVGTVSITGAYGTLVIGASGAFAYTSSNTAEGTDQFTYTLTDFDGDRDTAVLSVEVTDIDTKPSVTPSVGQVDETNLAPTTSVVGSVGANFADDGPGTFAFSTFTSGGSQLGGALTSGGNAVNVTLSGNTYTGVANGVTVFTIAIDPATGGYTFTQYAALDHADGTNPNDVITLQFGVNAVDADGDATPTTITISVLDDAPVAADDGNTVATGTTSVSGNVLTNDDANNDGSPSVTQVTFNGTIYSVPAAGTVSITGAYGTLVIGANGAYTYTSSNTAEGTDNFVYTMRDFDGDTDTAKLSLTVEDVDTKPSVTPAVGQVDETNLAPTTSVSGSVGANFGDDAPGSFSFTSATPGGSLLGGALTSGGNPVTVALSGNTYTGTANGVVVFTITLDPATGGYVFTQNAALDHADGANPNDVITLRFGVNATDSDGDSTPTSITISVLDDAPVAVDDGNTVASGTASVSGNVLTNDDANNDGSPSVTQVTFNGTIYTVPAVGTVSITGAYGTLVIGANGAYTYTSSNTAEGTDNFVYTMRDFDGDTDTAKLSLTVADVDTKPVVTPSVGQVDETNLAPTVAVNGSVSANFGDDAPGSFSFTTATPGGSLLGGALTSGGNPVTVALSGNTYTGTANGVTIFTIALNPATGTYVYTQFEPLDHANGSNPNDVITLQFGVNATDSDGDTTPTTITISVLDDGPVTANDSNTVAPGTLTVGGNVVTNDNVGQDTPGYTVTQVTFGTTTVNVPATGTVTINGTYGTLVIGASGAYTYTSKNTGEGTDQFTYQIRDFDGDTAAAKLTINVPDIDTCPVVNPAKSVVDETVVDNAGSQTVTGTVNANFGDDAPGTITPTGAGSFGYSGSVAGGTLTSNGNPVTVTLVGNQYVGTAAGVTIFTLTVGTNGAYSFTLNGQLDHANAANPDDVLSLQFGVTARDADGDTAATTITINVHDDGPVAVDDTNTVSSAPGSVSGNVTTNDDVGADEPGYVVTQVTFNGTVYNVPATGTVTVNGAHGTLTIGKNGAYTYQATSVGSDQFVYKIVDQDGDPATAKLTLTVNDLDTCPTAENSCKVVDETNLDNSGTQTVNGTLVVDYKADGPGTTTPSGASSFNATGSIAGGTLKSNGSLVTVTLVGDTYTGTSADGRTVFTLKINTDATYTFKLIDQLDHADKTNPDDIINLNFGYTAKDTDNDTANAVITIQVKDDGPVAVNDSNTVADAPGSVTGNVLTNDDAGADEPATVKKITFGSTTVDVPATGTVTINGAYGKLTIAANGSYTYQGTAEGVDQFTYRIEDYDGDPATAKLTITVLDDDCPTIKNVDVCVDETDLGPLSVTGNTQPNFFGDGPGTVKGTGASTFQAGGSLLGGTLKSNGVAVLVTFDGATNTYTGKAGDTTVFNIKINNDGTFKFTLFDNLDHADALNPNDEITLNFGVTATDADGDVAVGTIKVTVKDDAPCAADDCYTVDSCGCAKIGNVLLNNYIGQDGNAKPVKSVWYDGTSYDVTATGSVTIDGANGRLTLNADGSFLYKPHADGWGTDVFKYTITDFDKDPATAKLTFNVFGDDFSSDNVNVNQNVNVNISQNTNVDVSTSSASVSTTSHADLLVILENSSKVTISDFDAAEGDTIDLSSLVQDFDPAQDAINDFVFARSEGQDTVLSIDPDGNGGQGGSYDVVVLKDVTSVHVEDVVQLNQNQQNQGGLG